MMVLSEMWSGIQSETFAAEKKQGGDAEPLANQAPAFDSQALFCKLGRDRSQRL